MTYNAVVRLGKLVTPDVLRSVETLRPGAEFFQRGALQLGLDDRPVPVCIDHDRTRQVGAVRSLFEFDDTDGVWLAATATILDAPGWLAKGTPASRTTASWQHTALGAASRILRGALTELSILSPGVKPNEPGARVMVLERAGEAAARSRARRTALQDHDRLLTRDEVEKFAVLAGHLPISRLERVLADTRMAAVR